METQNWLAEKNKTRESKNVKRSKKLPQGINLDDALMKRSNPQTDTQKPKGGEEKRPASRLFRKENEHPCPNSRHQRGVTSRTPGRERQTRGPPKFYKAGRKKIVILKLKFPKNLRTILTRREEEGLLGKPGSRFPHQDREGGSHQRAE